MLEVRAEKLRREVLAFAGEGAGVTQLHERAIELVGETVRSDLTCWAMLDPESLAISSMTSGRNRIPQQFEPLLAESEYNGDDPGTFAELARSGRTVARASDLPPGEVAHSLRHGAVWAPLGLGSEVRIVFRVDGVCWGAAGFVRSGPDFTDRELEFLSLVAPGLAVATRAASVHIPAVSGTGDQGPAVVLTDAAGEPVALTAAARGWRDRLDDVAPGRLTVVLRGATFGARSSSCGVFKARAHKIDQGDVLGAPARGFSREAVGPVVRIKAFEARRQNR
ncbi:MAG: hypothetical protein AAGC80_27670, partial [Rhodococcus sp. (in: high G+C Gram-positive bacteria)]